MSWITLRTTSTRWEAELMQQVLTSHEIASRIVDLGVSSYMGYGCPAALQVLPDDRWTALLLLSPIGDDTSEDEMNHPPELLE
ncbi:hypothetical protein ACN4EK_28225 [Pantanalinema rosaneae CENA516]|uniref:hypothetical protein n=1 Tax=Pantanalinema rosaneae TaxID=1620701 RepID=UPI003D6E68F8